MVFTASERVFSPRAEFLVIVLMIEPATGPEERLRAYKNDPVRMIRIVFGCGLGRFIHQVGTAYLRSSELLK